MDSSWDEYAAEWDSNADVVRYAGLAFDSLVRVVDLTGRTVLDFGSGTGLLTERMAPYAARIVALDPSPAMVDVLRRKQLAHVDTVAAELSEATIAATPLLHTPFDLIVASSVCAFLPDYPHTLQLFKSLLKPGGVFVQWDWQRTEAEPDFGFTAEMMAGALRDAGLTDVAVTNAFSLEHDAGAMAVLMGVARKESTDR